MLYFDDLSIIPEDSNNQAKALFRPGPKLTASSLGVSGQHLTHIYGLVQERHAQYFISSSMKPKQDEEVVYISFSDL